MYNKNIIIFRKNASKIFFILSQHLQLAQLRFLKSRYPTVIYTQLKQIHYVIYIPTQYHRQTLQAPSDIIISIRLVYLNMMKSYTIPVQSTSRFNLETSFDLRVSSKFCLPRIIN